MKKILFSSLAIVAVVAIAGVASWAVWSDEDTSESNIITSGSMTLEFNDESASLPTWLSDLPNAIVNVSNVFPGDEDEGTIQVRNAGDTVDGLLSVSLADVVDLENGRNQPELAYPDNTNGVGELCQHVEVMWTFDDSILSNWKNVTANPVWDFGDTAVLLSDGSPATLTGHYRVSVDAENDTMTDGCRFDIVVTLDQIVAP